MAPPERTRPIRATVFTLMVLAGCSRVSEQPGPPVRLSAGSSDTIIVNSVSPTALPVRAFDAAGRLVSATVRYAAATGPAAQLSPDGVATCDSRRDFVVRARSGTVSHSFMVHCRPIAQLQVVGPVQFVLGDSALSQPLDLPLLAFGPDWRAVTMISGIVKIFNDSVAYARGSTIVPRSRGVTLLHAWSGGGSAFTGVHIYQRVESSALDTLLRIEGVKRQLAVPIALRPGEVWRHALPRGDWMVTTLSPSRKSPNGFRLRFENATCEDRVLNDPGRFICKSPSGTVVFVERPKAGKDTVAAMTYLLVRTLYPPAPTITLSAR